MCSGSNVLVDESTEVDLLHDIASPPDFEEMRLDYEAARRRDAGAETEHAPEVAHLGRDEIDHEGTQAHMVPLNLRPDEERERLDVRRVRKHVDHARRLERETVLVH